MANDDQTKAKDDKKDDGLVPMVHKESGAKLRVHPVTVPDHVKVGWKLVS